MKAYKLTNEEGRTHDDMQWGPGVTHTAEGPPVGPLCSGSWIHVYSDPLLAVMMNPLHEDYDSPRLWECRTKGRGKHDRGLKSGYRTVTTVRELPLPKVTTEHRIRFAILCTKAVCDLPAFVQWADKWLSGEDRTARTSWPASWAAETAARAAAAAHGKPLDLVALAHEAVKGGT